MSTPQVHQRNTTLDALRGVAALAVVVFHLSQVGLLSGYSPLPSGFLSVDFFFILSGFVVAHTYSQRLTDPSWFGAFVVARVIRILPLAILGVLAGAGVLFLKWLFFPDRVGTLTAIIASVIANLFLLPAFFVDANLHHDLFPSNGPLWSLFFEMVASLAWGKFGIKPRTRSVACFSLVCALLLVIAHQQFQSANIGFDRQTFLGGFPRVGLGFSIGVVMARCLPLRIEKARSGALAIISVLLVLILGVPVSAVPSSYVWPISCEIFLFPMIIFAAIIFPDSGRLGVLLGRLSYPLYILHFPILLLASGVTSTRHVVFGSVPSGVIAVVSSLVVAELSLRYLEPFGRRQLKRVLSVLAGCLFEIPSASIGKIKPVSVQD